MRIQIYVVVGILLLGSLTATGVLYKKWRTSEKERKQAVEFSLVDKNTIDWYKNKLGRETAKVKVLDQSNRNIKALRESDRINFVRQFEGVKRNLRNVEQIQATNLAVLNSFNLGLRDSLGSRLFALSSPSLTLSGSVTGDSIRIRQTLYITLQGAIFWQRKRFLGLRIGRKVWEAQLTSPDPNVRITGFEVIRVGRK